MKITVVGGGSTYTPELADGLGRLAPWVTELVLVDPDQTRLNAVGPVSARIMRRHGHPAVVRWTDNLDDALDGAAAVLIQLRVGGQAARNLEADAGGTTRNHCNITHGVLCDLVAGGFEPVADGFGR